MSGAKPRWKGKKMVLKESYECDYLCKWGINNVCKDYTICAGCSARLPETGHCRCAEVDHGEECPYYEPFETS